MILSLRHCPCGNEGAESCVIGLESIWEASPHYQRNDLATLFIDDHKRCSVCVIEAAYIERYGRDPVERLDADARKMGRTVRIDFADGTQSLYIHKGETDNLRQQYPGKKFVEKDIA